MAGRREVFDEAMRQGHSAAWDQNWERAITAYRKALQEFPEDTSTLTSLGLALLQIDDLGSALDVYQRSALLNPNDPVALEKSADILERLGRLDEAADSYNTVAEVHLTRRDVDKAIENWQRATQLSPGMADARSRLALSYERLGKERQAVFEYLALARIMQRKGDFAKAMEAAQRAQNLDPQDPEILVAIDTLRTGGELPNVEDLDKPSAEPKAPKKQAFGGLEETETGWASQDKLPTNPMEDTRERALSSLASAMFDVEVDGNSAPGAGSSSDVTNPLIGTRGNRVQITSNLGQAIDLQMKGKNEEAISAYEKALKSGLDHAAAHYNLAGLYMDIEKFGQAARHFKEASAHPDYAAGSHFGLGIAYARARKLRESVGYLLHTLRLVDLETVPRAQANGLRERYETIAENLEQSTSDEEAAKLAEALVGFLSGEEWKERIRKARQQLNDQTGGDEPTPLADLLSMPGSEHLLESLSKIDNYLSRDLLTAAMDEAQHAVELAPTYLPVHLKMADILLEDNRLDAAIRKYSVIADVFQVRGEAERAGDILLNIVQLAPMDVRARSNLVELLVAQGKADEAISQYIDMAETYYRLADLDMARDTYANALRLSQRSSTDRAWTVQILHQMGDIDVQRLDWRQALRVYEQIKTLTPNDYKTRKMLLDLNFRLGQARQALNEVDDLLRTLLSEDNSDAAIGILKETVESRPDEMGLRSRLAQLYQQVGRNADAIKQLDALGEAQLQARLTNEAIDTVNRIISMEPKNVDAYRKLLAHIQGSYAYFVLNHERKGRFPKILI